MKLLLIIFSIIFPILMVYIQNKMKSFRTIFNVLAFITTVIFGGIASTSIYQIIVDHAVFMTTIHGIFLNPFFLITGAYLGVFLLYRFLLLTLEER
ncbi:transposase [Rummeliibacillus pycnus]|uniref:transposase n=1 Tax=Rummeliibacillus pycnus TaxID=101070 RepID=UPI000C9BDAD4|nr:transposase [Rummeliibacillus pycnus]